MENVLRCDSALWDEIDKGGVPEDILRKCIQAHIRACGRLHSLNARYIGWHPILARHVSTDPTRPNNRLVCNHAKYITDMTTGYLLGEPVKYSSQQSDLTELNQRYKRAGVRNVDPEIAKDMSVYGRAYELLYYSSDKDAVVKVTNLNPTTAFVVYDDTVEKRPLFGVHYLAQYDNTHGDTPIITGYTVQVMTATTRWNYTAQRDLSSFTPGRIASEPHRFSDIPMIEYANNEEYMGDFEPVISLMDAYNLLQSDRVNDVERFVQAILFLRGFSLDEESAGRLRTDRILVGPDGDCDAQWLVNALAQGDVEVIRQNLESDIHKFAMVPRLTDEQFAGNSSGVAMKYKLLGFDQLIKIKERYMEQGLRQRLRLFTSAANFPNDIAPDEVEIQFTHSLPVNELEVVQLASMLSDLVSNQTAMRALEPLGLNLDPEQEAEQVLEEKKQNASSFGLPIGEMRQAVDDDGGQEDEPA